MNVRFMIAAGLAIVSVWGEPQALSIRRLETTSARSRRFVGIGSSVAAAERPSAEQPPVEQPPVEQPAVEQPAVEQPAVEQPAVEQPPKPLTPSQALSQAPSPVTAARLPVVAPAEAGFDAQALAAMEPLIVAAIAERKMPGAVVCLGRRGRIGWLKAYGDRQLVPERQPMTVDTVFDLASLTKPIATATAVMKLVETGRVRTDEPIAKHLPEFAPHGKDVLTLEDLLVHHSGLIADNPLSDYGDGREQAWSRICGLKLVSPPRTKFIYSDVNFIVLGELVSRVSGEPLERFVRDRLYRPLGMSETGFLPGPELRDRAAPTQQRDGRWMRGEVHDPRAWKLGGVAGHAGLFSTAADLARYAQAMLNGGQLDGNRVLAAETVERMARGYTVSSGLRGLGWDKRTGFSINRGDRLSDAAFGHGGFTGTVIWIDPKLDLFVIFLSNRVHPDGKGLVNPLAGKIATIAADAVR